MSVYYEFEVKLLEMSPAPTRHFLLHQSATFLDLHDAIQHAFNWDDDHLWGFGSSRSDLGDIADSEGEDGPPAERVKLTSYFGEALGKGPKQVHYIYDFGDSWQHLITFKRVVTLPKPTHWRKLLAGAHVAPLEDCGGAVGYERLRALATTGEDPWGELEVDEIDDYLEERGITREGLASFDLLAQSRRFDVPLDPKKHKHIIQAGAAAEAAPAKPAKQKGKSAKGSAKPVAAVKAAQVGKSKPGKSKPGAKPVPPPDVEYINKSIPIDAALFQASVGAFLKHEISPAWLHVFELIEDFLFTHRGDLENNFVLGLSAWLYILVANAAQGGVIKERKAEIHAASVIYWIDTLHQGAPPFKRLSEQFGVSIPSVRAAYAELEELLGDARSPRRLKALMAFHQQTYALLLKLIPPSQPSPVFTSSFREHLDDLIARLNHTLDVLDDAQGAEVLGDLMGDLVYNKGAVKLARRLSAMMELLGMLHPEADAVAAPPKQKKRR